MKRDLKTLKHRSKEEKLKKQFLNPKNQGPCYLSPDDGATKEQRRVRRLNRMLRETKDNDDKGTLKYLDDVRSMRLGELLEKQTMESQRTIVFYFINLVAMVFLLLI